MLRATGRLTDVGAEIVITAAYQMSTECATATICAR
jgi:hypothetical protein